MKAAFLKYRFQQTHQFSWSSPRDLKGKLCYQSGLGHMSGHQSTSLYQSLGQQEPSVPWARGLLCPQATWCPKATNDLHSLKPCTGFCLSVYTLSHLQKGQCLTWELISDRADALIAGAKTVSQNTGAVAPSCLEGHILPFHVWLPAELCSGWSAENDNILASWFLPKIWCFHVQPPSSKWRHPDLEEILCQLQMWCTNCTKSMVIHRKVRATMDIHGACDAMFYRGEMQSSLSL